MGLGTRIRDTFNAARGKFSRVSDKAFIRRASTAAEPHAGAETTNQMFDTANLGTTPMASSIEHSSKPRAKDRNTLREKGMAGAESFVALARHRGRKDVAAARAEREASLERQRSGAERMRGTTIPRPWAWLTFLVVFVVDALFVNTLVRDMTNVADSEAFSLKAVMAVGMALIVPIAVIIVAETNGGFFARYRVRELMDERQRRAFDGTAGTEKTARRGLWSRMTLVASMCILFFAMALNRFRQEAEGLDISETMVFLLAVIYACLPAVATAAVMFTGDPLKAHDASTLALNTRFDAEEKKLLTAHAHALLTWTAAYDALVKRIAEITASSNLSIAHMEQLFAQVFARTKEVGTLAPLTAALLGTAATESTNNSASRTAQAAAAGVYQIPVVAQQRSMAFPIPAWILEGLIADLETLAIYAPQPWRGAEREANALLELIKPENPVEKREAHLHNQPSTTPENTPRQAASSNEAITESDADLIREAESLLDD